MSFFFLTLCLLGCFSAARADEPKADITVPQAPELPTLKDIVVPPYKGPLAGISSERSFDFLSPLIIAQDLHGIIRLMRGLSGREARALISKIVQAKNSPLKPQEKVRIIVGVVGSYFDKDFESARLLLDIVGENPRLYSDGIEPLILSAARHKHPNAIAPIVAWSQEFVKKHPEKSAVFADSPLKAARAAVASNDAQSMRILLGDKAIVDVLSKEQLGQLLVEAGRVAGANPEFVSLFIQHGTDINAGYQGCTSLICAAEVGNLPFVKALIAAGADEQIILDPAIGTALQRAIETRQLAVEEYLRLRDR